MESMVGENHQLFRVAGKTDPFLLAAVMCNRLEQPTYSIPIICGYSLLLLVKSLLLVE